VKGDVEQGFREADVILEMDTSHHNPTQARWIPGAVWPNGRMIR